MRDCDTCLYSANPTGQKGTQIWCALLARMVDSDGCGQYRLRQ